MKSSRKTHCNLSKSIRFLMNKTALFTRGSVGSAVEIYLAIILAMVGPSVINANAFMSRGTPTPSIAANSAATKAN